MCSLLYVSGYDVTAKSGTTEHVFGLSTALAELGWAVTLTGPRKRERKLGVSYANARVDVQSVNGARLWAPLLIAARVRQLVGKHRYDVAYVRYARKTILAVEVLKRARMPYVVEVNTNIVGEYRALGASRMQIALARLTERLQLRKASGAFCMTNELTDYAGTALPEGTPTWITGNGFDAEGIRLASFNPQARESLKIANHHLVLVFLGSLQPWQGMDCLVEVLGQVHGISLLVIGDGPERSSLTSLSRRLGVDNRIRWLGWQEGEEVHQLLRAADVAIGSLALNRKNMAEAQPLKVRHYLGSGLPTIIGYRDALLTKDTPGVFLTKDENELRELITNLKDQKISLRDPIFRQRIREFAIDRLSWAAIARKTSGILRELIGQNTTSGAARV